MNPILLGNSLLLAGGTACLGVLLGIPVALVLQVAGRRWRRGILGAALATLALPGFLVAGMWMEQVGFAGAWRWGEGWWVERLMPMACSAGVLGLMWWPITALLLDGAWQSVDGRWLEAMPELRGRAVWDHVLWPSARAALGVPWVVTAILALGQFTVPALFQAKVWPAEVWVEYSTRFDERAALVKSVVPGILVLGLLLYLRRRPVTWTWGARSPREGTLLRRRLGIGVGGIAWALTFAVLGISLVFPVVSALGDLRTWRELPDAWRAASPAVGRSALFAGVTATAVCAVGAAGVGRRGMMATVLPLVFPGVLAGIALSRLFALPGIAAARGTWAVVFLALGLRYAFVGWYAAERAWRTTEDGVRAVVRMEGLGAWWRWRHVLWEQHGGVLRGSWLMVYLLCLWDVETLILVVPPGGDTLSLMVFNLLHYGHNAQVTALCFLLGVLAVLPVAIGGLVAGVWGAGRGRKLAGVALTGLAVLVLGPGCVPETSPNAAALDSRLFERVEVIGGRGTGPGFFNKPRSVAVDDEDNLYVVDMTGRVQRFDPDGRWVQSWQMPETTRGKAKGMDAVPGTGVVVVEPHYHRVNQFAADGRWVGQWGRHGTNRGELWFPRAVALGREGDCYVSEYGVVERVQRFRLADGGFLGGFGTGGTGPGEFNRVEGLDVGPDGSVFVADSCNHRVQVFSADGRWVRGHGRAGQGPGEFSYPYDIRVDRQGRQFVCEFGNSRVQVLDANDRPLEVLGGAGAAPDRLNNPWSLCLDSHGNLYVADAQNHRVVKYVRRAGS